MGFVLLFVLFAMFLSPVLLPVWFFYWWGDYPDVCGFGQALRVCVSSGIAWVACAVFWYFVCFWSFCCYHGRDGGWKGPWAVALAALVIVFELVVPQTVVYFSVGPKTACELQMNIDGPRMTEQEWKHKYGNLRLVPQSVRDEGDRQAREAIDAINHMQGQPDENGYVRVPVTEAPPKPQEPAPYRPEGPYERAWYKSTHPDWKEEDSQSPVHRPEHK